MHTLRLKAGMVLMLMMASMALAAVWRPTKKLADSRPPVALETFFPAAFAGWRVDRQPVQLVSPDAEAMINKLYNQTLSRAYVNGQGERIMLSVAYGGDQSDATRAHRPEVCYPAQGFQIMRHQTGSVAVPGRALPVRQLVAKQGGRNEPITYWITVGNKTTLTGTEQKLAQLSYSMRGLVPDGMLVRVSSIDRDEAAAFNLQQQFIAEMAAVMTPSVRAQVLGVSSADQSLQ